jgi:hypothetical protein
VCFRLSYNAIALTQPPLDCSAAVRILVRQEPEEEEEEEEEDDHDDGEEGNDEDDSEDGYSV